MLITRKFLKGGEELLNGWFVNDSGTNRGRYGMNRHLKDYRAVVLSQKILIASRGDSYSYSHMKFIGILMVYNYEIVGIGNSDIDMILGRMCKIRDSHEFSIMESGVESASVIVFRDDFSMQMFKLRSLDVGIYKSSDKLMLSILN